jgi:phosphotriesterase-related protein
MTATVNTVLGPIAPEELGVTLMHEHIIYGAAGWYADNTVAPLDREDVIKSSLSVMKTLKRYGLQTFVDATANDTGRDADLLKEISAKSGVNVVCATGLYTEAEGASPYFRLRTQAGDATSEICELFMKEITEGIGTTKVKAGVIKVATGHGRISAYEEMVLRAAARAQKETGVPIITHTEAGTMGPEQADLLISEGVTPGRIMVGHMCGSADLKYHTSVLEKGVYIAFDRLGLEVIHSDAIRKACIIGLISIGYADRIMLSHDSVMRMLGRSIEEAKSLLLPNWVPTHIFENIIPALHKSGVTAEKIRLMMVDNPRRLFAG